jgi:hypothetical protein
MVIEIKYYIMTKIVKSLNVISGKDVLYFLS